MLGARAVQQALVKCLWEAHKVAARDALVFVDPMSNPLVAHAMELWILIRTLHSVEEAVATRLQSRAHVEVEARGHSVVGG